MQEEIIKNNTHDVFLVDDTGISWVFPILKKKLAGVPMLSLLYYSLRREFAFKRELDILQRHFPTHFFVSFEPSCFDGHWIFDQESIEAVINANTLPKMHFMIAGNDAFIDKAKELLYFLGMKNIQIIQTI